MEILEYVQRNTKLVDQFVADLPIMSSRRVAKHRIILRKVQERWLRKGFEETTRADLKAIFEGILGSEHKPSTQRDYSMVTKRFFRWLRNDEFVKGFTIKGVDETVGPEDILTDEELFRVYQACHSLRDKALSCTMYETAMRPHELLRLKKTDVALDDYGAIVYVRPGTVESNAKTGARRVRVINAAPLLANWIENHPLKDRDAPLWVDMSTNTTFHQLRWSGLRKIVRRWAKESRVEKKFTPYLFRHTRLTHLAKFMTEAQLCVFAGWKIGSGMPRMYVHLSGKDVDDSLLKAYGLKKEDELELKVPRKCVRCGATSNAEAETCSKCGMAMTLTAAMRKDEEMDELKRQVGVLLQYMRAQKGGPKVLDLEPQDVGESA